MITPQGNILLLETFFDGGLMDCFNNNKTISLNYVLINKNGKIKKNSLEYLKWPEWHYDFMSCKASYKRSDNRDYSSEYKNCTNYMPFYYKNRMKVGYYLCGDRKYAYEINFTKKAECSWKLYDFDTLGISTNSIVYHDDFSKYSYFKIFLERKYQPLKSIPQTYCNYNKTKNEYSIENVSIKFVEIKDSTQDYKEFSKWKVICKDWEISLNGTLIFNESKSPLINVADDILYVTVFNFDSESCRGYGHDIYPILYCIDIKNGKIKWKQEIYSP